jgi:hypothetical protein
MAQQQQVIEKAGAGEANRTPDPNLGKVFSRVKKWLKSWFFRSFWMRT